MSAIDQKQTSLVALRISAFGGKAGMPGALLHNATAIPKNLA